MLETFGQLFGTEFMPHRMCLRETGLIALHALSDTAIALAYLAIPLLLVVIVKRRRDIVFSRVLFLFATFILSCGATHVLGVVTLWVPVYRFEALVKVITAVASIGTAIMLYRLLPELVHLPSPTALRNEIAERQRIEREIRDSNRYLELRVIERTNELERTNLRLVESELRVRNILDGARALVYVKDLEGRFTFVNKAFGDFIGLDRQQIIGHTDAEIFPPEEAVIFRENDQRVLAGGPLEFEEVALASRAETIFLSSKFALTGFDGKTYAVCGMSTDITQRREAEIALLRAHEELRESEERLRQVMDLVPDMLWSAKVDNTIRFISQRFLEFTGHTVKDLETHGFGELFHPDDASKVNSLRQSAIETGDATEVEARLRRHDGLYRWFLCRTVPVWDENFQVEYLIGSATDIHELKRTEQALRRSNEELEQFAYAAAHDLQEPMRNVSTSLGMLQRLIADRITADESEWIDKSIQNAIRMQAMVKDLLHYSRAVSDQDKSPEPVSAEFALQSALTNLNGAAAECAAHINHSPLPEVPVHAQHLVAVFQNLISNSLKYRKPGHPPEVSVSAQTTGAEWEFAVHDNGIGFDPAYSDRIFKVFKRLHTRDEYVGNGIGLAICARIVAHYGGRIWAEGMPGQGATFRFTLPTHQK